MKFLIALLAFLGIIIGPTKPQPTPIAVPHPTEITSPAPQKIVTVGEETFAYSVIGPLHSSAVSLALNLPQKQSSGDIKETQKCTFLTSGGFYDTNDTPIGLFLVEGVTHHEASQNSLFNGYLWGEKNGAAGIGTVLSDKTLAFGLQTGPILIDQGALHQLKLTTDQNARRIVAGVTGQGELIFMAVYADTTEFSGPLLVDLPSIIQEISKQEHLGLASAINLDGGNHSTFYSSDTTLTELSPVGSTFCVRE